MATEPARKRRTRSDGERSYRAILDAAARLATLEGLEGLSFARVADEIGMSKSGLFSHFASKQDLQLATIATAEAIYAAEVIEPAMELPEGLATPRAVVRALPVLRGARRVPRWLLLRLHRRRVGHPRRADPRSRARGARRLGRAARSQPPRGPTVREQLARDVDIGQLIFEINALLHEANGHYLLFRDTAALERAQTAIADRLARAQR